MLDIMQEEEGETIMVKIGIVGCGMITKTRHAPEYGHYKGAKIVAWYNRSKNKAEELASLYGGKVYETFDELLESDVDALGICSFNADHYEQTIKALNAGKHVLVEKPMAMSLKECEDMVALAKQKGLKLLVAHNQRLMAGHCKAKELIDEGMIGRILSFETYFCHGGPDAWLKDPDPWFFHKEKAVLGAMGDLGVHKADLINDLLNSRAIELSALMEIKDKCYPDGSLIDVDDNALVLMKMENGVSGTMRVSWTNYGEGDNKTILYGTKGVMELYRNHEAVISVFSKDGTKESYDVKNEMFTGPDEKVYENSGVIDTFIEAIENDKETCLDGVHAIESMKTIFACVRSSEEKKIVTIRY